MEKQAAWITVGANGRAVLSAQPFYRNPRQWAGFCRSKLGCDDAEIYRLAGAVRVDDKDVPYAEDLVSSAGMAFTLFRLPGLSDKAVARARRALRRQRDVVYFYSVHVSDVRWCPEVGYDDAAITLLNQTVDTFRRALRTLAERRAERAGRLVVTAADVQACLPEAQRIIMGNDA